MSNWDEYIFHHEDSLEFLDELIDLEQDELVQALDDAVTLASNHAHPGDTEYTVGLCAASIAAIWCGATFSSSTVADEHPFVREFIGQCPDGLQERAGLLIDAAMQSWEDEVPEGLETFAEALT